MSIPIGDNLDVKAKVTAKCFEIPAVTLTDATTISWDLGKQQSAKLAATDTVGVSRLLPNTVLSSGIEQGEYKIHFMSGPNGEVMQFDTNYEVIGEFDTGANKLTIVSLTINDGLGKVILTPFIDSTIVESVTGNLVDNSDPKNPVVNADLSGIEQNKLYIDRIFRNTWHSGVYCGVVVDVADDFSDLDTKTASVDSNEDLWLVRTLNGMNWFAYKNTVSIDFLNAYFAFVEIVNGEEIGDQYFKVDAQSSTWNETTDYNVISGVNVPISETALPGTSQANFFNMVQFSRISDVEGAGEPADYDKVVKVTSQSFTDTEKTQGRTNLLAEKRSQIRVVSTDPTSQNFIDWEGDILLVQTAKNFVLPVSGTLTDGARYLVKTDKTGTVAFSTADGTVSIEYNDINALGNMVERSEAWILFKNDVYYITGEVA